MLRKTILAITAAAALGVTALAPTSASAWGWHGYGHGYGYGHGWYGPRVVFGGPGYGGCMVREWVPTPGGPVLRWVNRCY
jgi:hypothetical protein